MIVSITPLQPVSPMHLKGDCLSLAKAYETRVVSLILARGRDTTEEGIFAM